MEKLRTISYAQFNRLKPATRRIKIAEDVIRTLALPKAERFQPTKLRYCEFPVIIGDATKSTQMRDILPKNERHCRACALGALFLSHVRLVNHVTLGELDPTDASYNEVGVSAHVDKIFKILRGYFSKLQLRTIEAAFEGEAIAYLNGTPFNTRDFARDWLERIPAAELRLIAICENIIRNKGDFDISDLPKKAREAA